jgi:tetratricopeptide (TPR) repeat protein
MYNLGTLAQEQNNFDETAAWYQNSLGIKERLNDRHGIAFDLYQLGIVYQERGQLDEAKKKYRQSLEIFTDFKNPRRVIFVKQPLTVLQRAEIL